MKSDREVKNAAFAYFAPDPDIADSLVVVKSQKKETVVPACGGAGFRKYISPNMSAAMQIVKLAWLFFLQGTSVLIFIQTAICGQKPHDSFSLISLDCCILRNVTVS